VVLIAAVIRRVIVSLIAYLALSAPHRAFQPNICTGCPS
jgi:hypothetical protein